MGCAIPTRRDCRELFLVPPFCKGGHIVALTVKGGQTVTLILSTTIKTSVTDHQVTESRVIRRA